MTLLSPRVRRYQSIGTVSSEPFATVPNRLTGRRPAFSIHAHGVRLSLFLSHCPPDTSPLQGGPLPFTRACHCQYRRSTSSAIYQGWRFPPPLIMSVYLGGSFLLHALSLVPGLLSLLFFLFICLPGRPARSLPLTAACKRITFMYHPPLSHSSRFLWPTTDLPRTLGASGLQRRVSPQQLSLRALPAAYA